MQTKIDTHKNEKRFSLFSDSELQQIINALFDFGYDTLCEEALEEMKRRKKGRES